MSKKKMPRAAMTLKDFHGGSIPSDLPLPSAPGMTVDRSAFERPSSAPWMSPTLGRGFGGDRGGGYNRQGAPNGVRTFEEKASYFPNPANIGRNYDEDERKPVDSRPRSSHSVDRYEDLDRYEERRPVYDKPVDRYSHEDKGGFEARGLPSNDRFSRSQPSRPVETDNYVHEEFGLIAPRLPQREAQLTSQLTSEKLQVRPQDTLASAPSEQAAFGKHSQQMSAPPFVAQYASSPPPRNWRAGAQQPLAPVAVPRAGSDSAPNVWTARREGEYSRGLPGDAAGNDNAPSSPWRHQRPVDAGPVDKGAPGRWPADRRPLPEQPKEASVRPSAYGSGYISDGGRPAFNPDVAQFQAGGHPPAETGQPGYLSDPGRGPYPEGGRVNYSESGRGMRYGEGRGRGLGDGNRGDYPEAEVRGYPDAGRGPYHEPARDRGDNRVHYMEQGRGGFAPEAAARGSFPNEVRRGYVEDNRWAAGAGYNDPERVVESERGAYRDSRAYPEAGRIGFDSGRPMYVDGSRGGYGEVVNNGELGRGVGYPDRVPFNDSGRGGYGRGAYAERGSYPDSYLSDNTEGGRHVYVSEPPRDNYMPSASRGAHIAESARLPYGADRDKGSYVDGSRGTYSADRERNGSSYGRTRSPDVLSSQAESSRVPITAPAVPADPIQTPAAAAAARPEPVERPKLKLLPRSKPLEKASELPVETFIHEETVKESRLIISEKRIIEHIPAESVDSVASDSSFTAGNQVSENGDDSSRLAGRPRLNLKPRSKATEPAVEDGSGKVRNTVFGGARPRELILKERGEDDALIIGLEPNVTPVARQEVRRESDRKDSSPYRKDGRKEDNVRRDPDRFDNRREQDRPESRRDIEKQERGRDINKQDSWRRPVDPPAPSSPSMGARNPATASASVDPVPATTPGKFGHTAPVSAADLAQAFSRSASLGSAIGGAARGSMNQRPALSPLARSPVHVLGSGYLNGSPGPYGASPKDAPFSRLAEGPAPSQPSQGRDVFGPPGGMYGGDRSNNGPGTLKPGSYGSGSNDPSRSASFGRHEAASVHDSRDWNDGTEDYPGKRGLPIRRTYD